MDGAAFESGVEDTEDDFKIKGAATRRQSEPNGIHNWQHNTPESCTICLEPITERAVAVPCNHLTFDFICLVSWLQERSTCPLCNAVVTQVQYDWRSPNDFELYRVPQQPTYGKEDSSYGRYRGESVQDFVPWRSRRFTPRGEQDATAVEDPALEKRRKVYRHRLYSLHMGGNRTSQYRDFTPWSFASSSDLQSRARAFLRRELQVFSFLDTAAAPRGGNKEFLIEYVVAILKTNEVKGATGHAEDLLSDYLGRENARLLLHELGAWLRSPWSKLEDWDRYVQYKDAESTKGCNTA